MNKTFILAALATITTSSVAVDSAFAANTYSVVSGDTLYAIAQKNHISVNDLKALNNLSTNNIFVGQKLILSNTNDTPTSSPIVQITKVEYRSVLATALNVRSGADTSFSVIGTLSANTKVEILSSQNGWSKIKFKNGIGYVSNNYLSNPTYSNLSSNLSVSTPNTSTSNDNASKPNTSTSNSTSTADIIYVVKSGDSLYRIAVNNKTTVAKLKELNSLKSDTLTVGQKLIIFKSSANANPSAPTENNTVVAPPSNNTQSNTNIIRYTAVKGDTLSLIANRYNTSVTSLMSQNKLTSTLIQIGQVLEISSVQQTPPETPKNGNIFIQPTEGVLTSPFGYRIHPISGVLKMHTGIDIAKSGTVNIVSAADGIVARSGFMSGYGEYIVISHTINNKPYATLYAHLKSNSRKVVVGDVVKAGTVIGLMGSTGDVTGQHLHFEVHDGGYNGTSSNTVDPLLYFTLK